MKRTPFDPRTMPLDGLRLIEASAGTGKTFSLAGLYLRLLVEEQLDVREILVITFTRAATRELRERIRARLGQAARIARTGAADPDHPEECFAREVIAASEEPPEALTRRLMEAAHGVDEASIFTIHGFAQRAAKENAFDSALPFDPGDHIDDGKVYEEATRDYWRGHVLDQPTHEAFLRLWPDPDTLDKALKPLRNKPHARIAGPDDQAIEKKAWKLRKNWRGEAGKAFAQQLRLCWEGKVFNKKSLKRGIEAEGGPEEALAAVTAALTEDRTLPHLPDWTGHLHSPEKQFAKRKMAPGEALLNLPMAGELLAFHGLHRVAARREAHGEIERMATGRKHERRQFSFADMVSELRGAVTDEHSGPRLCEALHASWPWALVDEFQDTDPQQYEILHRIYHGRKRGGLFLIGDPKQAIYGFRGGDVYAYLQAATDMGGDNAYSLDTNFRSTQGLLDAVETLYRSPECEPFLVDGIDFPHVEAGQDGPRELVVDGAALAPMTLWHLAPDKTIKGTAETACRAACVDRIRELLDPVQGATVEQRGENASTHKLLPEDIAVLVNSNAQASTLQRDLSGKGIAAVCLHQSSVFESDEAGDILHILQAAANPADGGLIRAALAGACLGSRLSDLLAMEENPSRWQEQIRSFQQAHERWRATGVLAMLQPLIQDSADRLLALDDGERRLSNYLQIAELLAHAETETYGIAGLLRWLRQSILEAGDNRDRDAEQLRLESDEASVRITTVHKAKGLEFPVVFIPFAPWLGAAGSPDKTPYHLHDEHRNLLIDPVGSSSHREQSIREARAEGLRLLYVALTRAELACFLPWGAANGTQNSALASLLHREDGIEASFWKHKPGDPAPLDKDGTEKRLEALRKRAPKSIHVKPLPAIASPASRLSPSPAPTGHAREDLPVPRKPWSIHSFSRLTRNAEPGPAAAGAGDEAGAPPVTEAIPDLPGGTDFGSAVHELLEKADFTSWPAPGEPAPDAYRQEVARGLRRYGISAGDAGGNAAVVDGVTALIQTTLHTPLPGIGPLANVPPAARQAEMEFMLRLGGSRFDAVLNLLNAHDYADRLPREHQGRMLQGLLHGFIDLVVERGGRFYVLDYKTNWLGPEVSRYQPGHLNETAHQHHYDLQYLLYLVALHRYLQRRLPGYEPEQHLGGARYLFLRGMAPEAGERGILCDRPDTALIKQLDGLLDAAGEAA